MPADPRADDANARYGGGPEEEYVAMDEAELEEFVRRVARDEIASLAGLVLRRTQEANLTRSPVANASDAAMRELLAEIFGEVLSDFSRTSAEPGT